MLAAVGQLCSTSNIANNLSAARSIIQRASSAGAKAVFLPEATDFIAPSTQVAELTRSAENKNFVKGICQAAKEGGVFVTVGVHEDLDEPDRLGWKKEETSRCFNTQLLISSDGQILQRYRKIHLFDVDIQGGLKILESSTTVPGPALSSPQSTPIGMVGMLTCYDLRFPEPSLALRRMGAEIITYPSAFTVRTGAAHWEILLRARAVETQSYVLAAAQVGAHEGTSRVSWGHACAVDPYGSIIAQCNDMQPYAPSFCLADIDLSLMNNVRKEMPLWDQRRYDVYRQI